MIMFQEFRLHTIKVIQFLASEFIPNLFSELLLLRNLLYRSDSPCSSYWLPRLYLRGLVAHTGNVHVAVSIWLGKDIKSAVRHFR
ncbi:unnamed protein product [Cylicocyclus nassatus]|uniref:Uncharacterized protein n=1 Tax=Cylicocyclus nassatus TaxID=53992 RepID=A0AA36H155_CYLNA|nr:unnamed protein product [Cylicocyclus nassatus]